MKNTTTKNRFLTSDIKLSRDSQGYFEAKHRFQGMLFDSVYYATRTEARRAAVEELNYAKETGETQFSQY